MLTFYFSNSLPLYVQFVNLNIEILRDRVSNVENFIINKMFVFILRKVYCNKS